MSESEKNEKQKKEQAEEEIREALTPQQEYKREKKAGRGKVLWTCALALLVFFAGWGFGTFSPMPLMQKIHSSINAVVKGNSSDKINEVRNVMENDWFFADQIDNLDDRLTDQALKGMTSNEEDTHTEYMSKDEIDSFTQSINRNFVGIGVQFTSTQDGLHLVTRVMKDSPAEKAGVQAGDIIHAVDGTVVDDKTADEIKQLVQGEEGTSVTIDFLRDGKTVTLKIVRAEVASTVDGKIRDDGIGYMNIEQFGSTTADEVKELLDEFQSENVTKLIIDLRNDGGGYLEALQGVLDLFLKKNTVFLRREYSDGSVQELSTQGGQYAQFGPIVLLVNENTASAAEAFTLAMKECRDDVTLVGTKTYGKGTVQVTKYFDDGSAIKYTNSKWVSPSGVWVNGVGITPDQVVELPAVLTAAYTSMSDDQVIEADSVSDHTATAQQALQFLGYNVNRTDGYFDESTLSALQAFEKDQNLEESSALTSKIYDALISQVIVKWNTDETADTQLSAALEVLNG